MGTRDKTDSGHPVITEDKLLSRIHAGCDWKDFEQLVAELWTYFGWETYRTRGGSDKGRDIIATIDSPTPLKHVVQVKHYQDQIGRDMVLTYASHRLDPEVDASVIVTSSTFTPAAKETAEDYNVKLVDGHRLVELIRSTDDDSWVERFTGELDDDILSYDLDVESKTLQDHFYEIVERIDNQTDTRGAPKSLVEQEWACEGYTEDELHEVLRDPLVKILGGDRIFLINT